ncbi:glutathione S-transferase family protein [Enterovibrio sp. ZSDZ35]|uniref:Glutathione S-transferase family protein n=1 Tax=Enterovibrio qingdaonensis TaxID=2899818 RepID=A0ABT5QID9_9GAMM|nr:glutathione S-transferase family protein [Enterovibrio sp. ZSDZ35]MDD1780752.1 glutathione S-transferase family protein [Enterovibrio sp. ZSDZ35]
MSQPKFKLYYWPLPFRGSFISYQFAYKSEPLMMETDHSEIRAMISMPPEQQSMTPFTGPPLLVELNTGRSISQMPAIVLYVSEFLGLNPKDPFEAAMCMKILMDCNDVLMEFCRYNGEMMWDRDSWTSFRMARLPRWMKIFDEMFARGYLGKEQVSYADISVYALFGNMVRCFPELEPDLQKYAPNVYTHCKTISREPSLASLVDEQERMYGKLYCGGQIENSIRDMLALD